MSDEKKLDEVKQSPPAQDAEVQEKPKAKHVFLVNWPVDIGNGVVLQPGKKYDARKLKLKPEQVEALKAQGAIE